MVQEILKILPNKKEEKMRRMRERNRKERPARPLGDGIQRRKSRKRKKLMYNRATLYFSRKEKKTYGTVLCDVAR